MVTFESTKRRKERRMTKTTICPVNDYIYITPIFEEYTQGGIALPQADADDAVGTMRGLLFAWSKTAYRMIEESIGPERMPSRFYEGAEVEYFGHSTTKIDNVTFHVVRPRDIWSIIGESDG